MSKMFFKIRGQEGFEISSSQGLQLRTLGNLPIPTFLGVLFAGEDSTLLSGQGQTVSLRAVLSDYSVKTDVVTWTQTAGSGGTFTSPNSLSTDFTISSSETVDVVLRCTIVRTTRGGSVTTFDDIKIRITPGQDIYLSSFSPTMTVDKNIKYFNNSWLGSTELSVQGNADTIFWDGTGLTSGSATYAGHEIQRYDVSTGVWQVLRSVRSETDSGFYTVSDNNRLYRYIPVWRDNGKIVLGNSVPFLKPNQSVNGLTNYGVFDELHYASFLNNKITKDETTVSRVATTINSVPSDETTDTIGIGFTTTINKGTVSPLRTLSTLQDVPSGQTTDSMSLNNFNILSFSETPSVTRTALTLADLIN